MKSITIAGRIGKDAQTRVAGNSNVTNFSVAVEDRSGREKRTLWFDCALWGSRGEKLAAYLRKGGQVAVTGDLSTREHDGKTYLTINAQDVTLLGDGKRDDRDERFEPREQSKPGGSYAGGLDDDSIPFAPEFR